MVIVNKMSSLNDINVINDLLNLSEKKRDADFHSQHTAMLGSARGPFFHFPFLFPFLSPLSSLPFSVKPARSLHFLPDVAA